MIENSEIRNNNTTSPTSNGGGLCIIYSNIECRNTIIYENKAANGGALSVNSSTIDMKNVTIKHNYATMCGGGIAIGNSSEIIFSDLSKCKRK